MTFLIYGPRLFGSAILDFTILPIFWLTIIYLRSSIDIVLPSQILKTFYTLSALGAFAIIISIANMSYDFIHIFKLFRSVLNGFLIFIFCYILFLRGLTGHNIIEIYVWAVIVHAAIVIAQFFIPEFNQLINIVNGYEGTSSRPTGLTWSLNASAVPSAFAILILLGRSKTEYLKILFIAFSMFLMGRTSFILTLLIVLISVLSKINLKQFMYLSFSCIGVSFLINPAINYLLNLDEINVQVFQYLQIAQLLLGQISLEETAYLYDLFEALKSFIFFPTDPVDFFLGAGISGRESIYIKSDMGWILNIYSFGLLGIIVFITLHFYLIYIARKSDIFEALFFITLLIFLLNFKENLLFARHISSVFFIGLTYILYPVLKKSFENKMFKN